MTSYPHYAGVNAIPVTERPESYGEATESSTLLFLEMRRNQPRPRLRHLLIEGLLVLFLLYGVLIKSSSDITLP
jgi:hypothetical protein